MEESRGLSDKTDIPIRTSEIAVGLTVNYRLPALLIGPGRRSSPVELPVFG